MKTAKEIPVAYEWHNIKTGHCYVDYVARDIMDEKNGYIKTPLYKKAERKKREYPSIKICAGCGSFAYGNQGHDIT